MKTLAKKLVDPVIYLFWWVQIGFLVACPPLHGLVLRYGLNSARSFRLYIQLLFKILMRIPLAILRHFDDRRKKLTVLSRVILAVTTRCTLNCDKCSAGISDLKTHEDIPIDELISDMDALLACTDKIYLITITGGEPFLHPQLAQCIDHISKTGKVQHINLITNGTIIPDESTLITLKNAKAFVQISKYPDELQPNAERLKYVLTEYGIEYIHEIGDYWMDMDSSGSVQEGNPKRRFRVCIQRLCAYYFHGKLHPCASSSCLLNNGVIADFKEDYLDLRLPISPEDFTQKWQQLQKRSHLTACRYCKGFSHETPRVPIAVQRKK